MAQALIRNLDDELVADYRAAAKRNGRSLEAEYRDGLARSRPKRKLTEDELVAFVHALWERIPPAAAAIDSGPYIREMRESL